MRRQSTEDFQGSEIAPHDTIMMDTWPCTLVQTHRMRTTKREPRCQLWTRGDSAVSVWAHQLLPKSPRVGVLIMGRQRVCGASPYFPLSFPLPLECSKKIKPFFKKVMTWQRSPYP